MRLLDVDTLEIKTFSENNLPEYAILSHTWGPDEVTYQELSLILRLRSMSDICDSQATETAGTGNDNSSTAVLLAAMEMLVRGNWAYGSSLPDISEETLMKRYGYAKIVNSAKEAKKLGYQWIWIDTCCIDKTSSAE